MLSLQDNLILFDRQSQLRRFLAQYLPDVNSLFSHRKLTAFIAGPEKDFADPFRYLWPSSPVIDIGKWQLSMGFSRYGHALFALDQKSFLTLAKDAWGRESVELNPELPQTDSPIIWGTANSLIHLVIDAPQVLALNVERRIRFEMYALPPTRITAESLDIVAVPLVDIRWFWQQSGSRRHC